MKLLVAIDFSPVTGQIIQYVTDILSNTGTKIWLIHVVQPDPDFIGYNVGPKSERDFIAKTFHDKHIQLQEQAKKLVDSGYDVTPLLLQGPTTETILKEADKLKVDTIAVGSHGHGMMHNLLIGSVSKGLLNHSKIPLLIVPVRHK